MLYKQIHLQNEVSVGKNKGEGGKIRVVMV